jgi:UPF0755 protein
VDVLRESHTIVMNLVFKLVGISILVLSIVMGWFWQSYNNFVSSPVNFSQDSIDFTITPGASLSKIANSLASEGVISDAKLFLWMTKFDGHDTKVKAGEYVLLPDMTPRDIVATFVAGKVKQYSFTLVEGWSFKQMMVALGANPHLKHQLKDKSAGEVMASIGHPEVHPEGQFLPDTYHFPADSSDTLFLQRAYDAMQKVLDKEWQTRKENLPYKTKYEALTMASIVEKETGVAYERKRIAGVFVRRLEKRMRLQTDPTVIYGMGDEYKGNLRKKDLKKDTPYNTYRRKGLPPTPIAMPGQAAINAALHPHDDDTLYFVAKGDGSHHFSSTMEAHNKAVRKFQIRQRKTNYRSAPVVNVNQTDDKQVAVQTNANKLKKND